MKTTGLVTIDKDPQSKNPVLSEVVCSTHKLEFSIEQTVYLKTDKEQRPRLVTGITLRPFGSVSYALTEGTFESWHYGFEMSAERDLILATSN